MAGTKCQRGLGRAAVSYTGTELGSALIGSWSQPRIGAGTGRVGSGSAPIGGSWNFLEAGAKPTWAETAVGVI